MRFTFGSPHAPRDRARLWADALAMAAAADAAGIDEVTVNEHHATASRACTSPLLAAAAVLARTSRAVVSASAVLVALHDPTRLAEEISFLDAAHPGRLRIVGALGYRPVEYELFDRPFARRGALMDEVLTRMLAQWRNGEIDAPAAVEELLAVGGQSAHAARRAVRHGLPFAPRAHLPQLAELHAQLCAAAGVPARCWMPAARFVEVHVATDPDRAWERVGRCYLDDAREYARWQSGGPTSPVFSDAADEGALRRSGAVQVVTPDECVALAGDDVTICLNPLAGGMPPEDAWASVELFTRAVLPRITPAR